MNPDVLTITVPTFQQGAPRKQYPSVNHLLGSGFAGGKKSPEYTHLFFAVRDAAAAEMARICWLTTADPVMVIVIRYVTDRRALGDPMNLGKCELDALEQEGAFPGVYVNDKQVREPTPRYVLDRTPDAIDRVSITVIRLEADGARLDAAPRKERANPMPPHHADLPKWALADAIATDTAVRIDGSPYKGGSVPDGFVVFDGRLKRMSAKDAMALAFPVASVGRKSGGR